MHRKKQREGKATCQRKTLSKIHASQQSPPACVYPATTSYLPQSISQKAVSLHSAPCGVHFLCFQIALPLVAAEPFLVAWASPPDSPCLTFQTAAYLGFSAPWLSIQNHCSALIYALSNAFSKLPPIPNLFRNLSSVTCGEVFWFRFWGFCGFLFFFSFCFFKCQHHILLVLCRYSVWKINQHLEVITTRVSVQHTFLTPKCTNSCNWFSNISTIHIIRRC